MTVRLLDNDGNPFTFFYTKRSPFSNFFPCTFTVLDKAGHQLVFSSSEQYFMYQKAVTFNDNEIAQQILQSTNPSKAKALGRKVRNFDAKTWDALSFDAMKSALLEKFSQNEHIRRELFSTYGSTIAECSPTDRLWGIGLNIKDECAMMPSKWKGKNRLGKALMEVRDQLSALEEFHDEVEEAKKNVHYTNATQQQHSSESNDDQRTNKTKKRSRKVSHDAQNKKPSNDI